MNLHHFIIISVGLMFLFYLGGIDTGSSKILDTFVQSNNTLNNATVDINQDISIGDISNYNSIKNIFFNKPIWYLIAGFLIVVTVLAVTRVSAFTLSWTPDITAGYSVLALAIWLLMAIDLYSVIIYMRTISGGVGWMFNVTYIIMISYMLAFAFSLFKFVRSGE